MSKLTALLLNSLAALFVFKKPLQPQVACQQACRELAKVERSILACSDSINELLGEVECESELDFNARLSLQDVGITLQQLRTIVKCSQIVLNQD